MRKIALRLPTTRRQISSTPRHSAFGTISDVGRSNWLLSRAVRECSMFAAGLELLLCQLRRQSDPTGNVIGVDLAKQLLESARTKAIQRRLGNIEFEVGDMLSMRFPVASFDAVVCVFGIFFVPDMAKAVSELWSRIRPGGKLAVTTWGPNFCEPASDAFWRSIKNVRPDLHKGFNPWDRIDSPASLRERFLIKPGSHHQKSLVKIVFIRLTRLRIGGQLF